LKTCFDFFFQIQNSYFAIHSEERKCKLAIERLVLVLIVIFYVFFGTLVCSQTSMFSIRQKNCETAKK
jgi:hypothetical protein